MVLSFRILYANTVRDSPVRAGRNTRSILSSLTALNLEFPFSKTSCYTKVKEPNLPYYLTKAGGRIVGCKILSQYKMQTAEPKIWTQVPRVHFLRQYPFHLLYSLMLEFIELFFEVQTCLESSQGYLKFSLINFNSFIRKHQFFPLSHRRIHKPNFNFRYQITHKIWYAIKQRN